MSCLNISREGHVDFFSVRGNTIQEQRVMHGAIPRCFKLVKTPAEEKAKYLVNKKTINYSKILIIGTKHKHAQMHTRAHTHTDLSE